MGPSSIISIGFTLSNVETQSRNVVTGLAASVTRYVQMPLWYVAYDMYRYEHGLKCYLPTYLYWRLPAIQQWLISVY